LVVRDDVGALLRLGEVIQNDDRGLGKPPLPRGQETPMTGDDPGLGVHQDRIVEAELRDAGGNLSDLSV
jgi:hypothetical protein